MKLHAKRNLFLLVTPIIASCAISTLSAEAATLARSEADFQLSNFSHNPDPDSTFAAVTKDTETFTILSPVTAQADGTALFNVDPIAFAANTSISQANGATGGKYTGTALSTATVQGIFSVAANETFSFDYGGFLNLAVVIDNPVEESAAAFGDITWQLFDFDTKALVDEFNVSKFLSAKDGNLELTQDFSGQYSAFFANATTFELVETKTNAAQVVKVPEASATWALLVMAGAGGMQQRRRDRSLARR